MGPVKFEDIPKVATSILNDDFPKSGFQLKTKQKTSWHGATYSSQVDFYDYLDTATPTKLTLAMPKPFGFSAFAVNKLELEKRGLAKLEVSKGDLVKNLNVEVKVEQRCNNTEVTVCKTYTGVKDTQLKLDWIVTRSDPGFLAAEATYARGGATCGMKFDASVLSGGLPDFGARYAQGPLFCSLLATKKLSTFDLAASYKVTPEVRVAASSQATSKGGLGSTSVGVVLQDRYRAKASLDGSFAASGKYEVAKGFSLLGMVRYNKGITYGVQVSVS